MSDWIKNNWPILTVVFFLVLVVVSHVLPFNVTNTTDQEVVLVLNEEQRVKETVEKERETQTAEYYIDIKGAVQSPGVYKIEGTERIQDIVELANGFTEKADVDQINLAQKVFDEMIIYIPEKGEDIRTITEISQGNGKVHLNTASQQEFESLPGIGAVKAAAIIQYRDEHGPFTTLEDLLQITGIGVKTVEALTDLVHVP